MGRHANPRDRVANSVVDLENMKIQWELLTNVKYIGSLFIVNMLPRTSAYKPTKLGPVQQTEHLFDVENRPH